MVINDPLFGQLEWDGESGCWSGLFTPTGGESYVLEVCGHEITSEARETFGKLAPRLEAVRSETAESLLPEFNEFWAEDRALTQEELLSHLHPSAIRVEASGHMEIVFEDECEGDIFAGHWVIARFYTNGARDVGIEE